MYEAVEAKVGKGRVAEAEKEREKKEREKEIGRGKKEKTQEEKNNVSQNSFSLYLYNQWTNFHKLSCTEKPQMRAICTYVGCTKATTNNWDIKLSVTVKALFANILWIAGWIHTIELALESAH